MIWVNFKIYQQTFSDGALKLAKICKEVSEETKIKIIPVVSALDLRKIKDELGIEVWLQHLDLPFEGKHTGFVSPLAAVLAGADGTLLNHSEHEIPPGKIRQILAYLKKDSWIEHWSEELKEIENWKLSCEARSRFAGKIENFKVMLCLKSQGQLRWLKQLRPKPDLVAYEPPELIGGEISVSEAKPEAVKRMVELLPDYQIIVGAGVKKAADVKKSLELGAKGVLVSSGVVTAEDSKKELLELAKAFKVKS